MAEMIINEREVENVPFKAHRVRTDVPLSSIGVGSYTHVSV